MIVSVVDITVATDAAANPPANQRVPSSPDNAIDAEQQLLEQALKLSLQQVFAISKVDTSNSIVLSAWRQMKPTSSKKGWPENVYVKVKCIQPRDVQHLM